MKEIQPQIVRIKTSITNEKRGTCVCKCRNCKKHIHTVLSRPKIFCGRDCLKEYYQKIRDKEALIKKEPVHCIYCEKEIEKPRGGKMYCDSVCYWKEQRRVY